MVTLQCFGGLSRLHGDHIQGLHPNPFWKDLLGLQIKEHFSNLPTSIFSRDLPATRDKQLTANVQIPLHGLLETFLHHPVMDVAMQLVHTHTAVTVQVGLAPSKPLKDVLREEPMLVPLLFLSSMDSCRRSQNVRFSTPRNQLELIIHVPPQEGSADSIAEAAVENENHLIRRGCINVVPYTSYRN